MADALVSSSKCLKEAKLALDSLAIFRKLLEDQVLKNLYALIDYLCRVVQEDFDAGKFINLYNDFFYSLVSEGTLSLSEHLINLILYHESPYSLAIEKGDMKMAGQLERAAAKDLESLELVARLSPAETKDKAMKFCKTGLESSAVEALPEWELPGASKGRDGHKSLHTAAMKELFSSGRPWGQCLGELAEFHRKHGSGVFSRYKAFIWERSGGAGHLKGIANPDPIKLSDLIGYENERAEVLENTLHFLNGFPANNVLLYGDRGTGKSSTVKALLNEYHEHGLRLVELPKEYLSDFPEVLRRLKGRSLKFIIFIDDLAFEDSAESYTALKAVLEGGLESRPANVLVYATSNRRHLIKEKFSDRAGLQYGSRDDEVRAHDTIQEKLSLADRFGITVIFTSPDREQYLKIVEGIAAKRGLNINRELLYEESLKWEKRNNGRSPRTARQFVDWLEGHIRMSNSSLAQETKLNKNPR